MGQATQEEKGLCVHLSVPLLDCEPCEGRVGTVMVPIGNAHGTGQGRTHSRHLGDRFLNETINEEHFP